MARVSMVVPRNVATAATTWRCRVLRVEGRALCQRGYSSSRLSISHGPEEPPLYKGTIPSHFASIVSQHGDRPAVVARAATTTTTTRGKTAQETTLTYSALDALSNTLASSLRSLGIRKGDRVAISLGNSAEYAALAYALYKLGAILVPLNPGFTGAQVEGALRHLDVGVLIVGAATDLAYKPGRGRSNEGLVRGLVADLEGGKVESEGVPSLKRVVVLDNLASHPEINFPLENLKSLTPFSSLLEGSPRPIVPDSVLLPSEVINIQFTSGTTSQPKAAMLSHTSILNNGALIAHRMGLAPTDRIVCPPPFFHCFGLILGYMATATTGAAILFPSPAFDPAAALRMAVEHDATGLHGVSTMMVAVLERLAAGEVASHPRNLRKGIAAGSSVPEALMRQLYAKLGLEDLVICYGMTETSPVSCMTTPSDPFGKRTSSVGRVMPHTAVKVVDPADRTKILPRGERGELAASGYLVMEGYWGDEVRTLQDRVADEDGTVWMYTGDEAVMDDEGYVAITGRIKDIIIRGGENIHPLEIENCLFQHPRIAEASVVGVPDERYGECVGVFVVLKKGVEALGDANGVRTGVVGGEGISKEEVKAWVREKLPGHCVPKHVFWIDEYPKTASGKIQKYKLRSLAKELVERV